jgi:hypothetical protein
MLLPLHWRLAQCSQQYELEEAASWVLQQQQQQQQQQWQQWQQWSITLVPKKGSLNLLLPHLLFLITTQQQTYGSTSSTVAFVLRLSATCQIWKI